MPKTGADGFIVAMLIAMLVVWAHADGAPVYSSMEEGQTIAYVFHIYIVSCSNGRI